MFNENKIEIEWCGKKLIFATGKVARQADSSVIVSYGGTTVMANVCAEKTVKPDMDFFPLTVNYQEKYYSVGKIPGGFFKREARPTEKETLVCRLIDRPIRPLFHKDFKNETQITCTVLSHDQENDSDIIAMIATSAALTLSGLPFMGPIGAAKIGIIDDKLVANPTINEAKNSKLELVVAGTNKGVLMVESEAEQLSEDKMLEAVILGQETYKLVIDAIINLAKKAAKEPWIIDKKNPEEEDLQSKISSEFKSNFIDAYKIKEKQKRSNELEKIKESINEKYISETLTSVIVGDSIKSIEKEVVRDELIKSGNRIDGRDTKTVRPIHCEVGTLERTHGSALFTRGETQALVVTTLGTGLDEQRIDAIEGEYKENFMLHYNFPPYSVGEVGRIGSTSRREIGHGKLAWRAIHPMLPSNDKFPYTYRVVSEITESNGSSSMATVCGTSLSLMDAGVPISKPIAGIAMGLIKENENYVILSDILGDEDHLGDMDFKVAGTRDGISAIQLDLKIDGISFELMEEALAQAKTGRNHILDVMYEAIPEPQEMSKYAPKVLSLQINPEKIGGLIGPGGKTIKKIIADTECDINVDDDGIVTAASLDLKRCQEAIEIVRAITLEPEVGMEFDGSITRLMTFGAFVEFAPGREGLIHISELEWHRVEKVEDVVKPGDQVRVKLIKVDDQGRLDFSRKALLNKPEGYVERPPRERRDNRRGNHSGGRKPFRRR